MLLRFATANFLSIDRRQEISLIASSYKDTEEGILRNPALKKERVLPSAVIYGANASGKSNFVAAIRFMCTAIAVSHRSGKPGAPVPRDVFALNPKSAEIPSVFDMDFILDDVRYNYGFECDDISFNSEWLYAYPNNRQQILFERNNEVFEFGRNLKGRNRIISDLTRTNSLFLSAAAQNDHQQLSKIAAFFRSIITDDQISVGAQTISDLFATDEMDARVIKFLKEIGTGVVNYRRRTENIPGELKEVSAKLFSALQQAIEDTSLNDTISIEPFKGDKLTTIQLAHLTNVGEETYFDLERESAGTRRLLVLLGSAFQALDKGQLLIVDELDASLHTMACDALIALFGSAKLNPKGAQLIATTHDTNLLASQRLRRDQIWFCEKDRVGATHLYPLTDIRTRKGDNLEMGYLQGRYGAIPFSSDVIELISKD